MRVFFNLFVLKPLLTQKAFRGSRLLSTHKRIAPDDTKALLEQILPSLKSLTHVGDVPNTKNLLAIRDNCHSLEDLTLAFDNSDEEHYPIYLDIVKANPNLTYLKVPWSNEIIDIMTKNNQKLKHIEFFPASSNMTLKQVTELFASIPSLVKFDDKKNIGMTVQDHSINLRNINYNCNETYFKSFVDVMRSKVTQWNFNTLTDSFLNEMLNNKISASNIEKLSVHDDASKLALQPLMKLFTSCPNLRSVMLKKCSLSSEEFDEFFNHVPKNLLFLHLTGEHLTVSHVLKLMKKGVNLEYVTVQCENLEKVDWKELKRLKAEVRRDDIVSYFVLSRVMPDNTTEIIWSFDSVTDRADEDDDENED